MNRLELIDAVAEATGATKKDVTAVLAAFIETVEKTVASGDSLQLIGFGTFLPRKRSARNGRNPKTGEAMQIAASTAPAFKASRKFKEIVNAG